MENNAYYEQALNKYWADFDEEKLISKISRNQRIVDELHKSPIWKIITEDAEEKKKYLDDNWQDIIEPNLLNSMRIKKSAIKYILELKKNYEEELDRAKQELDKRRNTDTQILKDYDEG